MEPQNNPYDFIMNAPKKRRNFINLQGNNKKQRLLQMVILVGVLVVISAGLFFVLQLGSKKDSTQLFQLSASQQDLMAMINNYSSNVRDQKLLNDSATIYSVIVTQNKEISEYMSKHSLGKSAKQIAGYRNNQYEKVLKDALATGKFEESYTALLANRLDGYRTIIRSIYASTGDKKLKTIMSNDYSQLSNLMSEQSTSSN